MHFKGVSSSEYTTAQVDLNKETLAIENNYANVNPGLGSSLYSKIEVLNTAGTVTYSRETLANEKLSLSTSNTTIKEGYKVRIFHANPNLLSIDNMTIANSSANTQTFLVTKLGLQQIGSTTNMKANLTTIIEKGAKVIRDNDSMLTSPYVEGKDDLLLAINLLDEPAKSTLLDDYKDVLPNSELDPKNKFTAPILDELHPNDTAISGKVPANYGLIMNIYNLDGSYKKYLHYTEEDRSFSIPFDYYGKAITLVPGMRVEIFYKQADLISPSTIKTVLAPVDSYSLTANDYAFGDTELSGTFSSNIAKVRLWINDKAVTQATTNSAGVFTFPAAANFIVKATDKVEIVGVDASYNEKKRIRLSIKGSPIATTSLTADAYTIGTNTLNGTFGKSVAKVRLWVNGKAVTQATTTSDGDYTFTNIASFIKNATDRVEIVGVNAQYQELNRIDVVVSDLAPLDNGLTAIPFNIGDNTLTGTFGKNVAKVRLWVNGNLKQQATTKNGGYTFTSTNYFITSPDDVVEVIGVDAQYKEVSKITLSL
ncbi:hypothetical protein DUK53_09400 [Listeria sp. SHR_NRA_18]|uniref:immunoglobulin-like domain-containing protein n=1 Tax=Listeria sp. SHR_NRA_18 TaxID=2269046 RepID=UPI0009DFAD64|nr:hypothetical protein DUK53_09400 [Listeria sp. SHR_NRA_18]